MVRKVPAIGLGLVMLCGLASWLVMPRLDRAAAEPADRVAAPGLHLSVGLSTGDELPWLSADDLALALDDAASVGGWVRLDISWANVQRDGAQAWDWVGLDRVVAAARARKLDLLGVLAYTPAWARPEGCGSDKCPPRSLDDFAAFVSAAVARFGPQGLRTWEIWNEPNVRGFWEPMPSVAGYSRLLAAAAVQIRAADPGATVLMGGLAAVPNGPESVSPQDFLRASGEGGAIALVDGIAYHPYTYPLLASDRPETFSTAWNLMNDAPGSLRSILAENDSPDMPIWVTEYGAPTGGPGTASDGTPDSIGPQTTHVTEERQAEIAGDSVAAVARAPGVRSLLWYSGRDRGQTPETSENFYGLRRADGEAKPALGALRSAVETVLGGGAGSG